LLPINHLNRGGPFAWDGGGAAEFKPLTVPLPQAPAVTGLSRSTIYRAAAEGKITLLKCGRSTLVDMASVRAFLAGLPRASIRPPREAA
jgi:excisionase family DNA binding protein